MGLTEIRHLIGRARMRLVKRDRDRAAIFAIRYEYWLAQLHKVRWQLQSWRKYDDRLTHNLDALHQSMERQLKPLENDLRLLKNEYDRFDCESVGNDPLTGRAIIARFGNEDQWNSWQRRNAEQKARDLDIRSRTLRQEAPVLRRHQTAEATIAALEEQQRTLSGSLESARRLYYEMGGDPSHLPR